MPRLELSIKINAPVEVCFDLARSIDLHLSSMKHTGEKAVEGITSGLIGLNQTVTWEAKHFGIVMKLTSKITECKFPSSFSDVMTNGPFKYMEHKHFFEQKEGYTLMTDHFEYQSPLGVLGKLVDHFILKKYMTKLLLRRNLAIKQSAESPPPIYPPR